MAVHSFKIRRSNAAQIENLCLKMGIDVESVDENNFYRWIDVTGPDMQVARFKAIMNNNRDKVFCEYLTSVDEAPATSGGNYRVPGQPIQKVPGVKLEVVSCTTQTTPRS